MFKKWFLFLFIVVNFFVVKAHDLPRGSYHGKGHSCALVDPLWVYYNSHDEFGVQCTQVDSIGQYLTNRIRSLRAPFDKVRRNEIQQSKLLTMWQERIDNARLYRTQMVKAYDNSGARVDISIDVSRNLTVRKLANNEQLICVLTRGYYENMPRYIWLYNRRMQQVGLRFDFIRASHCFSLKRDQTHCLAADKKS